MTRARILRAGPHVHIRRPGRADEAAFLDMIHASRRLHRNHRNITETTTETAPKQDRHFTTETPKQDRHFSPAPPKQDRQPKQDRHFAPGPKQETETGQALLSRATPKQDRHFAPGPKQRKTERKTGQASFSP